MPMPFRHPFWKFTCQACGWGKVFYNRSDVILGPGTCPKCGGSHLKKTKANPLESAAAFPLEYAHYLSRKLV